MKKFFKTLLIILIFLLIIFSILSIRKVIIINNIINADFSYTNYHLTVYNYNDLSSHYYDVLRDNDISISTLKNLGNSYESYSYRDDKNDESIQILTINNEKTAFIGNSSNIMTPTAYIHTPKMLLEVNNVFDIITDVRSITTEECNGKECYFISVKKDNRTLNVWIDKETSLVVRNITSTSTKENGEKTNIVMDWKYELNCVQDSDLQKPNLEGIKTEYK